SAEALVMIIRVVVIRAAAGDDTSRPAILRPLRWYGVFTIVALLSCRQTAFAIAKHRAVLAIRKRTAALNQLQRAGGFGRKLGEFHHGQRWIPARTGEPDQREQENQPGNPRRRRKIEAHVATSFSLRVCLGV